MLESRLSGSTRFPRGVTHARTSRKETDRMAANQKSSLKKNVKQGGGRKDSARLRDLRADPKASAVKGGVRAGRTIT